MWPVAPGRVSYPSVGELCLSPGTSEGVSHIQGHSKDEAQGYPPFLNDSQRLGRGVCLAELPPSSILCLWEGHLPSYANLYVARSTSASLVSRCLTSCDCHQAIRRAFCIFGVTRMMSHKKSPVSQSFAVGVRVSASDEESAWWTSWNV